MSQATERRCAWCRKPYTPYRNNQRYCPGDKCRNLAWQARHPRIEAGAVLDRVRVTIDIDVRDGSADVRSVEVLA